MSEQRIPVHIITGFLGAGKTTFLNHLIRHRQPERIIVIENEVGAANIDGALVVDGANAVVELTAGCICCSLNDDLYDVMRNLYSRSDSFDRVVIETTGIADPGSVAQSLLSAPEIRNHFDLRNIICIADARHIDEALRDTDEARRQIAAADIILLNKTDLVTPEQAEAAVAQLKGINPFAEVLPGQNGRFDVASVLDTVTMEEDGAERQAAKIACEHQHRAHDITSWTYHYDTPFDLQKLSRELLTLVNIYKHQVYRVKGILYTGDNPLKVVVQSVRNTLALTDGNAWAPDERRESKIVFIGKGVERASIERILLRCLVTPQSPAPSRAFSTGQPAPFSPEKLKNWTP